MSMTGKARKKEAPQPNLNANSNRRRLWIFRLITIFLIPLLLLGFLELALSVSGYGYPTSYFVIRNIDGQDFLVQNYKFSRRFFPKALARTPSLYRVPVNKRPDAYRIFVFGESAALGDVDSTYGMSRYLEALLEGRYPDTDFEVVCVALTAINSHVILPIARECARLDGDLWLVYMGNNEMVGPFGPGTVFGAKAPPMGLIRTSLVLKKTHVGQLISSGLSRLNKGSSAPETWGGINMFRENPLRYDDPARLRAYRNFEINLADMLTAAQKAGVPVILSTVGSNLKDCSPFVSLHRDGFSDSEKLEWEKLFEEGRAFEKAQEYEAALESYSRAAVLDSEYAELQYRMGICESALGHSEAARKAFVLARDYDGLPVRADTRINRILMDSSPQKGAQVTRIDTAGNLSGLSEEEVAGREFFYDHVHFNVEGTYAVARIMSEQVAALLPPDIQAPHAQTWLDAEACNRRLALTVWDRMRLLRDELDRIKTQPFTSQTGNPANREYLSGKLLAVRGGITANTPKEDNELYASALQRVPEDTMLIGNYAQFLDGMGMTTEAIIMADRFCALLPDAWTYYYRSALLAKAGRFKEARAALDKAMEMNSDLPQARELSKHLK